MTWIGLLDGLGLGCLFAGALLCLTSAVGLVRLPDAFARMHAATKPQALGVVLVLLGAGLRLRSGTDTGMLVLAACFQLVTIPVSGHLLARAQYRLDPGGVDEAPTRSPADRTGRRDPSPR